MQKKKIVAVGMSGGVDSTMAAYLLKKQGFEVVGLTMKIWRGDFAFSSSKSSCFGPGEAKDIKDAARAAKKIGIPHYVIDVSGEYKDIVIKYFQEEYGRGKTPNPCVLCNARIKFGLLLDRALASGIHFDYFATGHYARVSFDPKRKLYLLKRGADQTKDQSYFLYRLKQNQLRRIIFPLGGFKKEDVKRLAREIGFADYASKPESQNFVECKDYAVLLKAKPGKIIDEQGNVLGEHQGIVHYTVGQRKKMAIGGLKEPLYVLKIDAKSNAIIAGPKESLYSRQAIVKEINWLMPFKFIKQKQFEAKLRYGSPLVNAVFLKKTAKAAIVKFSQPQFAVTPGQSLVFYLPAGRQGDGQTVLGGGIIS